MGARILDLQRQHSVTYRIRLGEMVNGAPKRLDGRIRITSPNLAVVSAFVDVYGGATHRWQNQYGTYLARADLPILLIPPDPLSQSYEYWQGGVCQRRCDGFEQSSGDECVCPFGLEAKNGDTDCRPTTRLAVVCPEVRVLGVGMLVTHSRIAAKSLPAAIETITPALAQGLVVPAVLRIVSKKAAGKWYSYPQVEPVGLSHFGLSAGETPLALSAASTTPASKEQVADVYDRIKALDEDRQAILRKRWTDEHLPNLRSVISVADIVTVEKAIDEVERQPKAIGPCGTINSSGS